MIGLVHDERARARDAHVTRVEQVTAGVEAHHHPALAVGDIHVAGGVDGRALRLNERRRQPTLRRAPREELDAPAGQPVEHADAAIAVERADEELAPAPRAHHLRVDQRRAVEVALLGGGREARPAGRDTVHALEVVELAGAVSPAAPREVKRARGVHGQGGRGGDAAPARTARRLESLARHVHLDGEAGRQLDLRERRRGREECRSEGKTGAETSRGKAHDCGNARRC